MPDTHIDRQRFEELLADYVANRLEEADRAWMASYLAEHPDASTWIQVEHRLRQVVQSTASPLQESIRLPRLLQDFRRLHGAESWLRRIAQWFAQPHLIPAPAIALAAAVLVVQTVFLVTTQNAEISMGIREEAYRGMQAPCDSRPQLRIVFKPEAPQAEVVILLRKVEAAVTAGPTETGQLWIRIPVGRSLEEAQKQLQASDWVDEVITVQTTDKDCRP